MEEKKKNKGLVVTIIVLVLVILGLTGFIVYDKVLKSSDVEVSSKEEEKIEIKDNETKLNVSYENIKALYETVMEKKVNKVNAYRFGDGYGYDPLLDLYSEKENILNSYFDYETKMSIVFSKLAQDNKIKTKVVDSEDIYAIDTIKLSDVEEYYGNFFGKDQKVVLKNFNEYSTGDCKISSDNYVCTRHPGGGTVGYDGVATFFENYEIDKDSIYIYENVLYFVEDYDEQKEEDIIKYYKTYVLDEEEGIEYKNEITKLRNKEFDELLEPEYKEDFRLYKHTFKQNKDGSFYWYSTMPVNR